MIVWRVENSQGLGPYTAAPDDSWTMHPHCTEYGQPDPMTDGVPLLPWDERSKARFGFRSEADLRAWFCPEELARLKAIGFNIVQREASRVLEGGHQVAFLPAKIKIST